jgi:hypothetical protein
MPACHDSSAGRHYSFPVTADLLLLTSLHCIALSFTTFRSSVVHMHMERPKAHSTQLAQRVLSAVLQSPPVVLLLTQPLDDHGFAAMLVVKIWHKLSSWE